MFQDKIKVKVHSRNEIASVSEESYGGYNYGEEGEEFTSEGRPLEPVLSRTSLLILDYLQFLAARRIQTWWRGYHARKEFDKRWKAAITIQRWWRGFSVRQNWYKFIEDKLQKALEAHYNRAATIIQSLFRGWWVRQTVHDMHSLRRMQLCAAEDLLNCVAFKLHHLLRTYSIPGVYSLRNSHCLSKVEKLLASMNFRFHNDRVRATMAHRHAQTEAHRENFKLSAYRTAVPFHGPNFTGFCKPQCEETLRADKDMDRRMYKIIAMYEASQRDRHAQKLHMSLAEKKRRKHLEEVLARQEKHKKDFCGDVIASMRKWKILNDINYKINKDIFRTPENLEEFLNEIAHLQSQIEAATCHCQIHPPEEVICH